jgi:ABC-type Na+ efflux pump permease subunit
MNGVMTILKKEWCCFLGSDRGIFLLYIVLMLSWSIMLANPGDAVEQTGQIWFIFFSVVISANFSNTVFIAERVNGILEILLTSGLSRKQILYGKMIFVAGMSIMIGIICIAVSNLWRYLLYDNQNSSLCTLDVIVYCCAVLMNTATSAYFSVKMTNPRLLHLLNLLFLGAIVVLHTIAAGFMTIPFWALPALLLTVAACASLAAQRLYESEKILQPVLF